MHHRPIKSCFTLSLTMRTIESEIDNIKSLLKQLTITMAFRRLLNSIEVG